MNPSIFTSVINSYLPEPHASLLNGILFGAPINRSLGLYDSLKNVGLLHIVVLSGMNITLLGAMILSLTKFTRKSFSIALTISIIILFILFVGADPPIVRAGIMGILSLVAILLGRKTIAIYTLFISLFLVLLIKSEWLASLSLQLSYAATCGIILFGATKGDPGRSLMDKVRHSLWKEFKPSFAAQIFTAPLLMFYFSSISLIAPLANLLIAFTIAPLMVFGFVTAILGKINYLLGFPAALICFAILEYIIYVVSLLNTLSFASLSW